jgi:hypothetical protein
VRPAGCRSRTPSRSSRCTARLDDDKFERAAVRWLARFALERQPTGELQLAAGALSTSRRRRSGRFESCTTWRDSEEQAAVPATGLGVSVRTAAERSRTGSATNQTAHRGEPKNGTGGQQRPQHLRPAEEEIAGCASVHECPLSGEQLRNDAVLAASVPHDARGQPMARRGRTRLGQRSGSPLNGGNVALGFASSAVAERHS